MAKNKIRVPLNGERFYDIQVYNNQKVVHINKLYDKGMIVDVKASKQALQNLSMEGYILYSHLMLNMPGWLEALSKKRLLDITPLTNRTYDKAIKELIDKEYLIKGHHKDYSHYYEFYEVPMSDFEEEKRCRNIMVSKNEV